MAYLIDTDIAIEHLAGRASVASATRRARDRRLAISIVTLAELYDGVFASPNPDAHIVEIRHFVSEIAVITVSESIALQFGELRASLRRQGNLIHDFDLLIAATALRHDLTLLTRNRRHFARVPGLRLRDMTA